MAPLPPYLLFLFNMRILRVGSANGCKLRCSTNISHTGNSDWQTLRRSGCRLTSRELSLPALRVCHIPSVFLRMHPGSFQNSRVRNQPRCSWLRWLYSRHCYTGSQASETLWWALISPTETMLKQNGSLDFLSICWCFVQSF